jgi:hypothetical protein
MRGVARPGRIDLGEWVSLLFLAVIAVWGLWFGVQSLLTLWWPINAAYLLAGLIVAAISALVGLAILKR